jgi:succinate dehydrogenase/fumarate reductase flavoprotein subunit
MCDVSSPIDPTALSWWHTSRPEALKSQAVCHLGTNFHSFDPPCFCAKVRYQAKPMDGATLHATVERYNAFVDSGTDVDFGKPSPQYKIQTPPFYAAWATPLVHDTRAGLWINAQCQVMDMQGQVIPGLYCGGESAGGFNQHGLGRCTAQGYIAGKNAAAERP